MFFIFLPLKFNGRLLWCSLHCLQVRRVLAARLQLRIIFSRETVHNRKRLLGSVSKSAALPGSSFLTKRSRTKKDKEYTHLLIHSRQHTSSESSYVRRDRGHTETHGEQDVPTFTELLASRGEQGLQIGIYSLVWWVPCSMRHWWGEGIHPGNSSVSSLLRWRGRRGLEVRGRKGLQRNWK